VKKVKIEADDQTIKLCVSHSLFILSGKKYFVSQRCHGSFTIAQVSFFIYCLLSMAKDGAWGQDTKALWIKALREFGEFFSFPMQNFTSVSAGRNRDNLAFQVVFIRLLLAAQNAALA